MGQREWARWNEEQVIVPDDDTVITSMIQDDAVTTAKIPDSAITTDKIADDAVTTDKIPDDAIATAKIPDEAVTLGKIQDLTADRILGRLSTDGVTQQLTALQLANLLFTQQADIGALGLTTHSGTPDTTLTDVSGSGADAAINDAIHELGLQINAIRSALQALNLMA